jgi:2-keto-3-deoxy-L-rhamnonate aldolase RhmA
MRKSKLLAKVRAGKPARICNLGHFIPHFVFHAAKAGYDCIWLDLEHRAMGEREVQALLAYFHLADIDCMLRAPTTELTRLYRYLEDGATGLMIPHVNSVEKARHIVESTQFPPEGNRGFDGAGLDADFIHVDPNEFVKHANRETFIVAQIETPQALEVVEEIAAVPGLDGLFVGPGDLGLRLQHAGANAPTVEEATQRVAKVAAKYGKAWGRPAGTPEQLAEFHKLGATLLTYGGEFGAIMKELADGQKEFDKILGA